MARVSERQERGFKYNKRPVEAVRERANARGGGYDSMFKAKYKVLKVRDGKNLLRIMPPTWDDAKHYGYDLWVNYGVGVDNESYLSLSKMKGEKDPLAEARRDAERSGDKDLVKALNPRQRILMWVIDRNDEDEGPQLWPAPFSVDKALAGLSFDEDTKEVIYIDDPNAGSDVRFYKEGQGLKTDYPVEKMRIGKPSPLHTDKGLMAEWLEFIQQNPLPECVQFYDYDHIATTFDGTARTESKDDEDEKPVRRTSGNGGGAVQDEPDEKPVRSRQRAVDPDEDEPPFEVAGRSRAVEFDEDEPEEKPVRARRRAVDPDEDEPVVKTPIRDRLRGRSRIEEDDE